MAKDWKKLHTRLLNTSFQGLNPTVKLTFIYLILLADDEGVASISKPMLCTLLNSKPGAVEAALQELSEPDSASSDPEDDGRRVEILGPSQFLVVNYHKYQSVADPDDPDQAKKRQKWREDKRRQREKKGSKKVDNQTRNGGQSGQSTKSTTEENRGEKKEENNTLRGEDINPDCFWDRFLELYPKPLDGRALNQYEGRRVFDQLLKDGEDPEAIVDGVRRMANQVRLTDGRKFVLGIDRFLNGRLWKEDYTVTRREIRIPEPKPANGVDFYSEEVQVEGEVDSWGKPVKRMIRFKIRDGVRTQERFDADQWLRDQGWPE